MCFGAMQHQQYQIRINNKRTQTSTKLTPNSNKLLRSTQYQTSPNLYQTSPNVYQTSTNMIPSPVVPGLVLADPTELHGKRSNGAPVSSSFLIDAVEWIGSSINLPNTHIHDE